jgi:hypothetical protein
MLKKCVDYIRAVGLFLRNFLKRKKAFMFGDPFESFEAIRHRCEKTGKVTGVYGAYRWNIVLAHTQNKKDFAEIKSAAFRFNTANHILGVWQTRSELDDYLHKLKINEKWRRDNPAAPSQHAPYSPGALAASAVCAFEFEPSMLQSMIVLHEKDFKDGKTTFIPFWNCNFVQPVLKVEKILGGKK